MPKQEKWSLLTMRWYTLVDEKRFLLNYERKTNEYLVKTTAG